MNDDLTNLSTDELLLLKREYEKEMELYDSIQLVKKIVINSVDI